MELIFLAPMDFTDFRELATLLTDTESLTKVDSSLMVFDSSLMVFSLYGVTGSTGVGGTWIMLVMRPLNMAWFGTTSTPEC